jgi:hypothetical protein
MERSLTSFASEGRKHTQLWVLRYFQRGWFVGFVLWRVTSETSFVNWVLTILSISNKLVSRGDLWWLTPVVNLSRDAPPGPFWIEVHVPECWKATSFFDKSDLVVFIASCTTTFPLTAVGKQWRTLGSFSSVFCTMMLHSPVASCHDEFSCQSTYWLGYHGPSLVIMTLSRIASTCHG